MLKEINTYKEIKELPKFGVIFASESPTAGYYRQIVYNGKMLFQYRKKLFRKWKNIDERKYFNFFRNIGKPESDSKHLVLDLRLMDKVLWGVEK